MVLAGVGALVVIGLLGSQLINMNSASGTPGELTIEDEPMLGESRCQHYYCGVWRFPVSLLCTVFTTDLSSDSQQLY